VVLVVARGVALAVALVLVAEPELAAVRRVVAVRERAVELASAMVAVGQGLAEEERALPGALE